MFEFYYPPPSDVAHEARLIEIVSGHGGHLDYREAPEVDGSPYVCLTFEFDSLIAAELAAEQLRSQGHHVETICEYS